MSHNITRQNYVNVKKRVLIRKMNYCHRMSFDKIMPNSQIFKLAHNGGC